MFKNRSITPELMDDPNVDGSALRRNLEELEFINKWLGGNEVVTQALNTLWNNGQINPELQSNLTIADLGCGGGDILRDVADWAFEKNVNATLIGVDANPVMIKYAQQKCAGVSNIHFLQADVFAPDFQETHYDIVICSLFCHHFTDAQLQQLLQRLKQQARLAIIINDIHRHPFAYYSIKWLTHFFSRSYLVKNDAPLSVLRAFKRTELIRLFKATGFFKYQLRWQWAFRWQAILYTNR
ncbi:methyltransferase domain-containing protein [Adhaeribacter radiodurans]|uniref:Methyltransferase domain-containing protein n=1 Tax=Adhaeribacter radiodurans TaxID=2745197 RepID=A0A7L7LD79_9BACT|nr:methyltransferase domain-containing protein [Adhaeribacter radiodurans]QMU30485.1 methyltransferase domain-containing protein [Adhaeribacter radiodurans]